MGCIEPTCARRADEDGNAKKNTVDFDNRRTKHDVEPSGARHVCAVGKLRKEGKGFPGGGNTAARRLPATHSTHHGDALLMEVDDDPS